MRAERGGGSGFSCTQLSVAGVWWGQGSAPPALAWPSGSTLAPAPPKPKPADPLPVFSNALYTQSLWLHPNNHPGPKLCPPTPGKSG